MSLFNENPDPVSERPFFKSKTPLPGSVAQYFQGAGYFIKGITFLKKNPSIVKYLVFPFLFSAALYALMFFAFFLYSSSFVSYILPASDHTFLLKALWYILFFFVNVFVLIVMLMTVALVTNIIASPFYDHVSLKIEGLLGDEQNSSQEGKGLFWEASRMGLLLREEAKKSLFILLLPVLVALIPLIGPVLATVLLTIFFAWEYIDFSLSRKAVTLKERLSVVYRKKMYFLGFGTPLIIPVVNFFLFPIAIVGATLLYVECLKEEKRN